MSTGIPVMHFSRKKPYELRPVTQIFVLCIALNASADQSQRAENINPHLQRGVALGLYSEDPDWSYVEFLDEMKSIGASHVSIVVPWYLKTAQSVEMFRHQRFSVPMRTIRRTIKDARKRGFEIFLFPILRVEDLSTGWRGVLNPSSLELFFKNYTNYIVRFAKFSEKERIPLLSIGSELKSMEPHREHWRKVIASVRKVYSGKILYSANWDNYEKVTFVEYLDYIGINGYFELAREGDDPSVEQLVTAWRPYQERLRNYLAPLNKPFIMTEVGYLSQKGTAAWPWKEGADGPLDLEIQRRCYEAFRKAWDGEQRLLGVYFWNWFGWGGVTSKEYTPRGKPAARELAKWYLGKKGAPHPK